MLGWLRRWWSRRSAQPPGAGWTQSLSRSDQLRLEELVRRHFAERGEEVVFDEGIVVRDGIHYGLENLAQWCGRMPRDEWQLAVEQHFAMLAQAQAEQAEWAEVAHDFGKAAGRLLLRIYPAEFLDEGRGEWLVHRTDLPGTATVLVADLPSSVLTLRRDQVAIWGRSVEDLFALAHDQLADLAPVQIEWTELAAGQVSVAVLSADHLYAATHALRLAEWPELCGVHGTLLAVPSRHALLAVPIHDARVRDAIRLLAPQVRTMFTKGPGSIAADLFWRRPDGTFERQGYRPDGGTLQFEPAPGLAGLLRDLTA